MTSMLVAEVNTDLTVSFDPEAPAEAGVPSGIVVVRASDVGSTELPVPFQLVGTGTAQPSEVLSAIRDALTQNGFQLHATAIRLNQ